MRKLFILLFCIAVLINSPVFSQDLSENREVQPFRLKDSHSVSVHVGYQDFESQVVLVSGNITATSNMISSLSYQYWPENHSAISFSVGILTSETQVSFSGTFTKTTIPILMGYSFYPKSLHWGDFSRGYFGMNIGAYVETTSGTSIHIDNFGAGTDTSTHFGANLNFGMDFFPTRYIRLGPQLAWHSTKYLQGPAVTLTLGVLL